MAIAPDRHPNQLGLTTRGSLPCAHRKTVYFADTGVARASAMLICWHVNRACRDPRALVSTKYPRLRTDATHIFRQPSSQRIKGRATLRRSYELGEANKMYHDGYWLFLRPLRRRFHHPIRHAKRLVQLRGCRFAQRRQRERDIQRTGVLGEKCMDTISDLIREHRARAPSAPALVYEGNIWSFEALEDLGARAATGLARVGVGAGDPVALWLPNTPAYLALWLGCARLGAVAVAVNTRFRSVEVADVVSRSGTTVMAMWPGFRSIPFLEILAEIDPGALERLETIILYDEGGTADHIPEGAAHTNRIRYADFIEAPAMTADRATPEAGCNMFTTSGTTKAPKFVMHSQSGVSRHARTVAAASGYAESAGGILQALPLCGVFGFCQATAALAGGRPMLLMSAFEPSQALRLIENYQVEYLNGTDDMLSAIFAATDREIALPSVKHSGFASFAAEPDTFMNLAESRGLTLVGLYGMSEVQAFFARQPLNSPPQRRRLGGGLPLDDHASVRVTDPDSGAILPLGEHGEIQLKGPSQMMEYFQDPRATDEASATDGYLRSGDLGYATSNGGVRLPRTHGRCAATRGVLSCAGGD